MDENISALVLRRKLIENERFEKEVTLGLGRVIGTIVYELTTLSYEPSSGEKYKKVRQGYFETLTEKDRCAYMDWYITEHLYKILFEKLSEDDKYSEDGHALKEYLEELKDCCLNTSSSLDKNILLMRHTPNLKLTDRMLNDYGMNMF
jgi:hypothetical protein